MPVLILIIPILMILIQMDNDCLQSLLLTFPRP